MENCISCDKKLDSFDVGCYRKLVNRGAVKFQCMDCLASDFGWSREELDYLVQRFREQGCSLFPPLKMETGEWQR